MPRLTLLEAGGEEKAMNPQDIEFGLDSFVYVSVDESGRQLGGDEVIRNTIDEAVLADAVGIDSFNIAEHYRPDMMDSAGSIILATIALLVPLVLFADNVVLVLGINSYLNVMSVAVGSIVLLNATIADVHQKQIAELQEKRVPAGRGRPGRRFIYD